MITISKSLTDDYFHRKSEQQRLTAEIKGKDSEASKLKQQIDEIKQALDEIHRKLNLANRDMKLGRLSYEEFQQLNGDKEEKQQELQQLNLAAAENAKHLEFLKVEANRNRAPISTIKQTLANEMVEQLAEKVVDLAGEPLNHLINAVIVGKNLGAASSSNQNRNNEILYSAICRTLFERMRAINGDDKIIPDIRASYLHIEELINHAAGKTEDLNKAA